MTEFNKYNGVDTLSSCRLVYGDGIPRGDGNYKEKGVDALLVADLIYHSALKNIQHAVVITHDTDFVYALRRVEDFGVTTAIPAFISDISPRLAGSTDNVVRITKELLISNNWAQEVQSRD